MKCIYVCDQLLHLTVAISLPVQAWFELFLFWKLEQNQAEQYWTLLHYNHDKIPIIER